MQDDEILREGLAGDGVWIPCAKLKVHVCEESYIRFKAQLSLYMLPGSWTPSPRKI